MRAFARGVLVCALAGCGGETANESSRQVDARENDGAPVADAYSALDADPNDAWVRPTVDARVRDAFVPPSAPTDATPSPLDLGLDAARTDATPGLDAASGGAIAPPDAAPNDAVVPDALPPDAARLGDVALPPPPPPPPFDPCQCPAPQVCERGYCAQAAPCADDGGCPAGWLCESGECVECRRGESCNGGTVCQGVTCADARRCVDDADCLAGRTCTPEFSCGYAPVCAFEDRVDAHGPDTALRLGPGLHEGFGLCELADDWFIVESATGLRVTARAPVEFQPPTLFLYAGGDLQRPVDQNQGIPGTTWVSAAAGEYLLRVAAPGGSVGPYTVEVVEGCPDDPRERPWRNDTVERARSLPLEVLEGTLCHTDVQADEDWFVYTLDEPARVSLEVLEGRVEGTVDDRLMPADLDRGATIRLRGEHGSRWRLNTVRRADPVGRCADAPALPLGGELPVAVFGGRNDFDVPCLSAGTPDAVYRLDLVERANVTILLETFLPQSSLVLLPACDAAAAPLDCSAGGGSISVPSLQPGTYWVVVEGPVNGTLRARLEEAQGCAGARAGVLNANAPLDAPVAPGRFDDSCLEPDAGEGLLHFNVEVASQGFLEVRSEGRNVRAALRSDCADVATELLCAEGPGVNLMVPRLEPGGYDVIVESDGPVTVRLNAFPLP